MTDTKQEILKDFKDKFTSKSKTPDNKPLVHEKRKNK